MQNTILTGIFTTDEAQLTILETYISPHPDKYDM